MQLCLAVDIEGVDCPSATPLPFDLDFLDILQRRDMVNTFGIEEGIRVVSPSCSCDRLLMVGNFEFWILPGWRPTAYSSSIFNHQGIFNVRNLHTGPPRFYVLIREDEENSCKVPFPRDTTSGPNGESNPRPSGCESDSLKLLLVHGFLLFSDKFLGPFTFMAISYKVW